MHKRAENIASVGKIEYRAGRAKIFLVYQKSARGSKIS